MLDDGKRQKYNCVLTSLKIIKYVFKKILNFHTLTVKFNSCDIVHHHPKKEYNEKTPANLHLCSTIAIVCTANLCLERSFRFLDQLI